MGTTHKPSEGFFITIEGGEGSGKSTLAAELEKHLKENHYPVLRTREPGGTQLSEHLRSLLLDPKMKIGISEKAELLLFLTSRVQHLDEFIIPNLHAHKIVICERFNDSTIAYQGYARHLGMEYVERLCLEATSHLEPNITFFLDLDPEIGIKRAKAERGANLDRIEKEHLQFHNEVRQGYLHLADKYPNRIHVLDATLPIKEVLQNVLKILSVHLKDARRTIP